MKMGEIKKELKVWGLPVNGKFNVLASRLKRAVRDWKIDHLDFKDDPSAVKAASARAACRAASAPPPRCVYLSRHCGPFVEADHLVLSSKSMASSL
jgi:hypothetical protein